MNQQTCNSAWLDAFLKNELNESEEQMLTSHLDECSDCREELESRAAEQSVWREASNMLGGSILLSTAKISDIRSGTVRSPQIELVLQQLAPTDDPESLGRIGGYEVTGVVGAGGMGVVLKAHDRSLDRIVAIKVMSPHLASSGSARRRFAREAKAAAAVLHPNVIAIHSVASEDANPFLVMPYVRGASLQKRIDSQGPLPLKDTLRIGAQIAAGLAAAHEQGLVHRDIKPANILLEEGVERVTITDFGLARAVDDASMTCSGVIAGTPQYMSPEQTRGEPIDARSDLFSLGSVLYAMCAGRSPFRAETTYGVLHRIDNDNPTPVCEVNSDIPVWLGHIIERLMAKRPGDRFESAAQVAELLEGCLAHVQQPAAIPLPEAVAALAPKKTRRPPIGKFIAAAAGAFALFAGILIVLELGKGTLTIESELDDVPIRIMQGDEVVKSLTVSKEGATTRIGAGKYIVEIGQEFNKAVIKDGGVELSRGATAIVKVTQTNANTPEDEKAKDEAAKAWLSRPVVGSTLDGKSFQLTGHDALMDCVMRNNSETLNRLLTVDKYDLDFSPRDGQWTLLQIALLHECVETTSLLLQHGANPNFASKGTPLPLELAKRSERKQLVALVQKYLESAPPVNTIISDTLTHTDVENIMEGLLNADLLRQPSAIDKSKEPSQTVQLDGHAMDFLLGLKGDWKLDAISFDGGKLGNVPRSKMSATIRPTLVGNNLEMFISSQQMGPAYEIGFLDTSITPMQITLNRYGTFQSLLSFEDEVLTLARPIRPGEPRPQSLQPAKGIVIYRWTRMSEQAQDRDSFVTIPLKAEWVPEEWLKRNMGRRHLTIVADGNIQDEAKPNVVNRVQRGILHDCRLESYEKMSRDGVEYWNARFFVPRKPVYSIGALWFKDAIRNDRIGDRHTPVPSPDLTQDNPQVKLDEAMKEGHVFRLDYVNDDFENNLPMVESQKAESTSIQETADSLVTITFAETIDGASITASGIGWRVDDAGHILLPSHVVAKCDDEAIQLRYASGEHCSAKRLKTLGHLTLLKSDEVVKRQAISLDSVTSLASGDAVSAILNGTDNVPGSIVKPRTTITFSELEGVKVSPELRFQNIITTDFVADDTTLSGAPLLTKSGDVAGMMIRLGSAQLIAIPVAEIREVLKQLQQVANSDPIRDHGLSTDSIETRTDGRFGILKIIEPTSLEDAVTKFNLLAKEHPLGRTQPELTVQEMTAAFRLWIASDECNEATRKDFQQVLDTQMLRPGHILQFNTKFETDGHLFEVWSIQFGDDKSAAWFKIRDSKLLSRLKTDEERKAWEQRIDQMKKSFREYKRWGDRPKADESNLADSEPKDASKDSAVTVLSMEFDTLEDFLKPGRELFDKEMKKIDERLAMVVEGSAEHSLLTTKKKQLQQQWDLSVAQVKGTAAASKAGKPVQLAPIVIPNNSRPWQAPMPDPLSGHDEDVAKVLAGTWQVKRFVVDREDMPFQFEGSTVNFSKNMMIIRLKSSDMKDERQMVYRIGHDKIDVWDLDSGHETACPYLGSYSIENDTLRICHHETRMELETPQSRPPVQPGKGFIYLELQRVPIAEFGLMVDDKNSAKSSSHSNETRIDTNSVEWPPSGFELTEQQIQRVIGAHSARIVRALDTPVDLVVDGKSSLAEIVSGIVREHRISVRLNEKSFEEQGVAIHHVPAFEVHGVTLKSALTTLLEKLLQHRSIPPVIEVRHGVLTLAAKAPSDTTNDLARSKPTSVVFQSMGPDKQALPETVVEVQGSDGVYFVLSDQNGLAPVVGHGVSNWYTTARDASGQLMAYTSHGMFLSKPTTPYVLNFTAPQLLTVNVSDEHGRPIEGGTVGILAERCRYQITDATGRAEFTLPVNNQYVQAIFALKSGKGLDYISYQPQWATDLPRELSLQLVAARELKVRLLDEQNQPLKGVPIYPVKFDFLNTEDPKAEKSLSWWKLAMGAVDWSATNEQGEVVFDWLPRNQAISFVTTNRELEHNTLNVTDLAKDVVEFHMTGPVEVSGRVLDIDGNPVAGASIAANNESGASANTDEEGRYVLKVRPGSTFYLEAVDSAGGGWMAKRRGISDWVEAVAGQPSKNNDVVIRPTARVFGRVTYTFDSAPAANIQLSYQFHGPAGRDPIKLKDGAMLSRGYGINGYTDNDGRFEFYAVPGKYTVSAVPDGGRRAVREFTVVEAEPHEANMAISKKIPVKGRVIAGDPPMPIGRVTIKRKHLTDPFGCSGYDWSTNEAGELDQNYRDRDPMILWGHSEDKQLWGVTDMAWDDAEFEMKLAPRAEMKIRILDSDQKPVANTEFTYGIFRRIQPQYQKEENRQNINVHSIEPREGTTDENGILEIKDLIVGGDYMIHRTASHFRFVANPDSPIAQAKILADSMAKDVVVDIALMNIGLDIPIPE